MAHTDKQSWGTVRWWKRVTDARGEYDVAALEREEATSVVVTVGGSGIDFQFALPADNMRFERMTRALEIAFEVGRDAKAAELRKVLGVAAG